MSNLQWILSLISKCFRQTCSFKPEFIPHVLTSANRPICQYFSDVYSIMVSKQWLPVERGGVFDIQLNNFVFSWWTNSTIGTFDFKLACVTNYMVYPSPLPTLLNAYMLPIKKIHKRNNPEHFIVYFTRNKYQQSRYFAAVLLCCLTQKQEK